MSDGEITPFARGSTPPPPPPPPPPPHESVVDGFKRRLDDLIKNEEALPDVYWPEEVRKKRRVSEGMGEDADGFDRESNSDGCGTLYGEEDFEGLEGENLGNKVDLSPADKDQKCEVGICKKGGCPKCRDGGKKI